MDFQFVSHSDFVSESAFVRGFARELWCQREMREMIIPEIQSQIKSLKQIGVEYTFTLDFFPRTGKSLICSQRRISVETSQRMLSIQGYRGTLSAWYWCQGIRRKSPYLRTFSKMNPLISSLVQAFLLCVRRKQWKMNADNKYTHTYICVGIG